jgi:hypothetical protein
VHAQEEERFTYKSKHLHALHLEGEAQEVGEITLVAEEVVAGVLPLPPLPQEGLICPSLPLLALLLAHCS